MVRVFIVDDHELVIEGIYSILQNSVGIEVAGHAINGSDCARFFERNSADIILMDISLPDVNGIDLCRSLRKTYPGIAVIALSTYNQGTYIRKIMEAGASGYLLKNAGRREIIEAIDTVMRGRTYLSFEAGQALRQNSEAMETSPQLTKREKEILTNIADGLTNGQIASKLFISIDTVESHRKNLHSKLNVKNTASLIRYAFENKII